MNAFADTLLSLVFGWMRALVEGIWSFISSGRFQSALSWLGDHWLWLVVLLCIAGTVLDYLIWLFRWRPYIIWRNKLRRLFGKAPRQQTEADVFQYGWEEGVDVDLTDMQPAPVPEAVSYEAWQQPVYAEAAPENAPWEAPAPYPAEEALPAPAEVPPPLRRNRRSQRHEKKKSILSDLLPTANDEEDALLDGLPPVVNKQQAFHAPVYPGQYDNSQG